MKYKKIFYREKYKKKYLNLNDNTISLPKSIKKRILLFPIIKNY